MKKFYWICFFFYIENGGWGFHPVVIENRKEDDEFIDLNAMCHQMNKEHHWMNCTVINWKEVSEEWFNKSLARSVTEMENSQKQKDNEKLNGTP